MSVTVIVFPKALVSTDSSLNPTPHSCQPRSFILYQNIISLCWHGIWPDGLCGFRPKAAGMRPVACGPHGPPPSPMPRNRSSPGSDARHRSPDMILGFTEYALFFPIYICLSFSLSLLFRQSLLYDSQFNISIRTRLISTHLRDIVNSAV